MQSYELETQKQTSAVPKYIHYEDEYVKILSSIPIQSICTCEVLNTILPGELSRYIYPSNSIISIKNGGKLKDILKFYEKRTTNILQKNQSIIYDIADDNQEVVEEDEEDEEYEEEDEDEDEGEEEEEWGEEDEEVEEIDDD
jgi:hypothetical protein